MLACPWLEPKQLVNRRACKELRDCARPVLSQGMGGDSTKLASESQELKQNQFHFCFRSLDLFRLRSFASVSIMAALMNLTAVLPPSDPLSEISFGTEGAVDLVLIPIRWEVLDLQRKPSVTFRILLCLICLFTSFRVILPLQSGCQHSRLSIDGFRVWGQSLEFSTLLGSRHRHW